MSAVVHFVDVKKVVHFVDVMFGSLVQQHSPLPHVLNSSVANNASSHRTAPLTALSRSTNAWVVYTVTIETYV